MEQYPTPVTTAGIHAGTDSPDLDLAAVAVSADWLAAWVLGPADVDAEVEALAATVSEYLRRLVEPNPCPPWCTVDHQAEGIRHCEEDGIRECTTDSEQIPTLTHRTISADTVRFTDLVTGRVKPLEVRIVDETMTPENALRLADQIRAAAGLATGQRPAAGRRSWCEGDINHVCDGTDCASPHVDVLATAGVKAGIDGGGVRVPIVSTYAQTDENGQPGVHVYVTGPISLDADREAWAVLTPAEARRYAAELLAHADMAERA